MDAASEFRNCGMAAPGSALLPISRRFFETLASRANTRNDEPPRLTPCPPLRIRGEEGRKRSPELPLSTSVERGTGGEDQSEPRVDCDRGPAMICTSPYYPGNQ